MLRPTQSLGFRPLPPLQKLFAPPTPIPLDPAQSKKLLEILTVSFRRQLAKEHSHNGRSFRLPSLRPERRSEAADPSSHRVDRHLQSLLTNPLFSRPREVKNKSSPMATFDLAVASGQMELQYAKGCLVAQKRLITESPELSVRDEMKNSGAGLKVLRWLQASGAVDDMTFLADPKLSHILLEFMVAEDLQEIAWGWLHRLLELYLQPGSDYSAGLRFSRLLYTLVMAEDTGAPNLDNAIACVSRAAALITTQRTGVYQTLLNRSCQYLTRTIFESSSPTNASSSLYDDLVELVVEKLKHNNNTQARLMLRHPTQPSASLALAYFRQGQNLVSPVVDLIKMTQDNIMLGIDAAHLLLEQNQTKDATWLIERLQRDYPKELKPLAPTAAKPEDELLNIQMLESLDLA